MLPTSAVLSPLHYVADPLADRTVATILGDWAMPTESAGVTAASVLANNSNQWERIALVNQQLALWTDNQSIRHWQPSNPDLDPQITAALQDYLQSAQTLPEWADRQQIARAEKLFYNHGVLSCTLLFCASLPECYVIPNLADVLHISGQLEMHTDYRVRATAAMIFPVMMHGGLTQDSGCGIAQILKVRLIHATIRNLIMRGNPEQVLQAVSNGIHNIPALTQTSEHPSMQQSMFAHGWQPVSKGLPCNQEELAYTLLTFGYVFLRGMRSMGIGLAADDELAYLHAWNVAGHVLGIQRELMADTMEQAEQLFNRMQAQGRAHPVSPDPRPGLGVALIATMEQAIPFALLKPSPALMTRHLCGKQVAQELGIDGRISAISIFLFAMLMLIAGTIDRLLRYVFGSFSISRWITENLGYHLIVKILMDQTRPLKLPAQLLSQVNSMMASWGQASKLWR